MSGSYRQCSECGKRALSIATRCPGAGIDVGRLLLLLALAAVLATGAVLMARVSRRSARAPAEAEVESAAIAATTRVDSATAAAVPATSLGEVLVAKTWTHVRNGRSVRADVEAVLLPGDTVVADSLAGGWQRVALEGEVLGYAHRSTLVEMKP